MDNVERRLVGRYYVRLKEVHINWTHRTGPKRGKEAYIPIPAKYAYSFNICKGDIYTCYYPDSNETVFLKAAGSQSRHEYAKQFQGADNLRILYDWYENHSAAEGDWVVVSIYEDKFISIEHVSSENEDRISALHLDGDNGRPEKFEPSSGTNQTGFRLVSLIVKNEDKVICDYNFFPPDFTFGAAEPLTTLIIGANSTGKSFVMKILSEIFQAVSNEAVSKALEFDSYRLRYYLNTDAIEIEIKNRAIIIHKNNVLVEKSFETVLPQKVLAIAFMLNDKFAFKAESPDKQSMYEYLGLRKTSNASWISTFGNRIAENILELGATGKLRTIIHALFAYFNLDPHVSIAYELSQSGISLNQIREMSVVEISEEIRKLAIHIANKGSYRKNAIIRLEDEDYDRMAAYLKGLESSDPFIPNSEKLIFGHIANKGSYRKNAIIRLEDEDYDRMAAYLKGLESSDPFIPNSEKLIFGHTFSDSTNMEQMQGIQSDYKVLKDLQNLNIIKDITLYVYKLGQRYSFEECSSGEKHILFAFLNIARHIQDNSLILIDEPEISLHPNWQMIYITALKRLFCEFSSCHFIITSHSPYLVSDLNPNSSSLIVLSIEDGVRTTTTLDYSTYAWSTENILYNVFHVRTTRNFYFDMELRELLSKTAGGNNKNLSRVKELFQKLSNYVFDDSDPLKRILKEVEEYIENAESE